MSALLVVKELISLTRIPQFAIRVIQWDEEFLFGTFVMTKSIENDLKRKKMISTPLIMEKPVRSPMVPPIRLSWASVLIFLSLSMSSKVAVSK